jgi:uncharacterized protein with GYD domain
MPLYMYQASYTSEAWAEQLKNPQNRLEQMRPVVEAAGGKLLAFYYAFGEYDVVAIMELPDNIRASALALSVAGGGALKNGKTTVRIGILKRILAPPRQPSQTST